MVRGFTGFSMSVRGSHYAEKGHPLQFTKNRHHPLGYRLSLLTRLGEFFPDDTS